MAKEYLIIILVRLVLPIGLLASIVLRPYGLSLIYLLLYLILPLTHIPNSSSFSKFRGTCLLIIFVVSFLLLLFHASWHGALASFPPYGSLLERMPLIETIGANLGFVSYLGKSPWICVFYIAPELVMTLVSGMVYFLVKKLLSQPPAEYPKESKHQKFPVLTSAGKYLSLFLIMTSGIILPSVTSGIYYLTFMGAATAWSLGRFRDKPFAVICRCLMAIMAVHVMVLLLYQCNWIDKLEAPYSNFVRYFGLTKIVSADFKYALNERHPWAIYANPLVILVTYFVLAVTSREIFKPKSKKKAALPGVEDGKSNGSLIRGFSFQRRMTRRRTIDDTGKKVSIPYLSSKTSNASGDDEEAIPLMNQRTSLERGKTSSLRSRTGSRRANSADPSRKLTTQDSTGSIIMGDDSATSMDQPALIDDIVAAIVELAHVLIRSSYIATTITMMAWSIMFHSWLTFVFLMWACFVWLRQDQRSFMLKTSPVLVVYAMLLLIAGYIYGMDLTQEELPSSIKDYNLHQIGLSRPEGEPFVPQLIKSLFTCMFWMTLRQFVMDLRMRRRSAAVQDLVAPVQLSVTAAATGLETQREEEQRSRLLGILGDWLKALCARYWIYVVVIMLFVIGITGERMTIFRIIYMFFFLVFILVFQISWHWWRRMMYGFWITLIIYSMINLILIYVYQFDDFAPFVEKYLWINERLQNDLGLQHYKPADLFVKLLTPTLFLIITIVQVHYFHKDFMVLTAYRSNITSIRDPTSSRLAHSQAGGASTTNDDLPQIPLEDEQADNSLVDGDHSIEMSSLNTSAKRSEFRKQSQARSYAATTEQPSSSDFKSWLAHTFDRMRLLVAECVEKIFVYLDIHLIKITMISLMLLCVVNVCAMHVPIMLMISPALLLSTRRQRIFVLVISVLISIYFMAQMVYQIDYISGSFFDVTCPMISDNDTTTIIDKTYNNADWVGFHKATSGKPLVVLLKGYIGVIALFTFYFLVTYRQQHIRELAGLPTDPNEKMMFPDVTREDADKNMIYFVKYLLNYGFYKFGVEATLICMMGVIGSRMDVYAVIYAGWLLVMTSIKRETQARIWGPFTAFVCVIVPVQYIIAVGVLPQLCVHYLWSGTSEQMRHIRTWLFLPYPDEPPHATKLVFDYLLLLLATRQLRVFRIEKTKGDNFPGGSNTEDTDKYWETPKFVNPVPDFLGVVGTWLDVLKRMVFLGMLWVTLAIMFLTGTNRVNLFSMGYLIGSFIFLWQGTDFYLLPKNSILTWWSWLLRYNVSVVTIKTLLQIPGCIMSSAMQEHACWLVQLLGIGCVDKFAGGNIARFLKMDYTKESPCSVPQEDIGLAWDGVCFAFLILQRRLFHSYYFYRVIDESKATTVLASRGAELIESLRQKQMVLQEEQEVKILEKIKVKMERIKANQKKILGSLTKDPPLHEQEEDEDDTQHGESERVPLVRGDSEQSQGDVVDYMASDPGPSVKRRIFTKRHEVRDYPVYRPPTSHQRAVRSGDYYMFDEFDDSQVEEEQSEDDDIDAPKEMGFGKLLSTMIKSDLKRAVALRRASAPAVRTSRGTSRRPSFTSQPITYGQESRKDSHPHSSISEREQPASDIDDYTTLPEQETWFIKLKAYLEAAWMFVESILVSITKYLMRYSRDYRYVSRTLAAEKRALKATEGFGIGLREGSQMRWEPLPQTLNTDRRKLSEISVPEIRILAPSMERGLDLTPPRAPSPSIHTHDDDTSEHESAFSLQTTGSKEVSILEEQDDSMFTHGSSAILHLLYAAWFAILAHTDIVCYIMVFINQIQSATILSIPLPLMVFLWGTLTIPRPTKTFWVTLIAYTEVIVLIKSMFQFEMLPWNQKVIPANMPFTAPRIIGIERQDNYALYDLLLLLIIFLHRFMLKSLGLWKESSSVELHGDVEYTLKPEDTKMLVEGKGEEVGRKYVAINDRTGPTLEPSDNEERSQEGLEDDPGPSKQSHDDHYEVEDDKEPIIAVSTTLENTFDYCPKVILLSFKRYLRPTKNFFKRMLMPGARVTADVYAYMFLCDFFNFLVVIFGFAAFGTHQGDGGVQTYLEENKVPIPFLVMLILQFALIIIDRALYLRKFMLGKILFQYALIICVHIWMFFVLPFITERTFNALIPPPMWYMVKCIYLLLSAYQIRCGYPRRIIGNFLCKSYRFLNMVFFRGFMAVPFVFELRTLMDWIWTDTSMTLMDWLKMEDIFASVFLLKCSRHMEEEFPQPRGSKKTTSSKYILGGSVLAFVIAIIWFPLVFFAFGNTVGQPNPPTDVTVKIRIGPFLPVYQMSAQSHNIDMYSEKDYALLSNMYARDRTAQTFLSNYMYNDVATVSLNPNSTMKWEISPPELDRLEREAKSNNTLKVKFSFVITHLTNAAQNPPTIEDSREVELKAFTGDKRNPQREVLYDMLTSNANNDTWLNIHLLFPKFLKVFNKGTAKPAYQLMPANLGDPTDEARLYRDVQMRLERQNGAMYWRVREACVPRDMLLSIPRNDCDMLVMYTFNDKLFPETLNFISGSGIIGLYTTFVFLASRVIRGFFSGIYTRIMFDDLPNVDRVLQLCLDIYLVREALELTLEEDLFAKLVFLYRSPETMIKWSRPREDADEQRALPPSR